MARKIFTSLFFLLIHTLIFSNDVSPEYAKRIATNFFMEKAPSRVHAFPGLGNDLQFFPTYKEDVLVYYYIEFPDDGYVVVSADQRCYPILAYSFSPTHYESVMPDACSQWFDWYAEQILQVKNQNLNTNERISNLWTHYGAEDFKHEGKAKNEGVTPLTNSIWGQRHYYNAQCPDDPAGPGGHAIAGCVATAMAQVMFYYRHPVQGEGANGYMSDYGYEYVDFEEAEYKWNEMVNAIHAMANPEIAELIYHVGVALEMDYGPSSSGCLTIEARDALKNFFRYSPDMNYISLFDLGYDFKDSLIFNLDQQRVVLYRGGDMMGGHAFVCDGYQDTSYFHFNWGWKGLYNGYFMLDNLNPGVYNFTFNQEALINIYPVGDYPPLCQGNQTLTFSRGTFADGSGPETCLPNSSCSWLLSPDDAGITNIQLWFTQFQTMEGEDVVKIFDGPTVNDPLIGQFSGGEIPPRLVSSGNEMLITFETGNSGNSQGWHTEFLAYDGPFCNDFIEMKNMASNYFNDGSGPYNYIDNSDCGWLIKPQVEGIDSVGKVHLYFHWLELAAGDTLFIYNGSDNTAPLIGKYFDEEVPDTIHSTTNELFLNFITDEEVNAIGWAAGYYSSLPVYCHDTIHYTDKTATFEDGSGDYIYVPHSDCYWLIETENTALISFEFLEFDLEYGYDQLRFYDASTSPPSLFATYWGHDMPPLFNMFTDKVLIHFTTDESTEFDGWKLKYKALAPGISEMQQSDFISLIPNPAKDKVSIHGLEGLMNCQVYDVNMSLISTNTFSQGNIHTLELQNYNAGIYFVLLNTRENSYLKKLIIY